MISYSVYSVIHHASVCVYFSSQVLATYVARSAAVSLRKNRIHFEFVRCGFLYYFCESVPRRNKVLQFASQRTSIVRKNDVKSEAFFLPYFIAAVPILQ